MKKYHSAYCFRGLSRLLVAFCCAVSFASLVCADVYWQGTSTDWFGQNAWKDGSGNLITYSSAYLGHDMFFAANHCGTELRQVTVTDNLTTGNGKFFYIHRGANVDLAVAAGKTLTLQSCYLTAYRSPDANPNSARLSGGNIVFTGQGGLALCNTINEQWITTIPFSVDIAGSNVTLRNQAYIDIQLGNTLTISSGSLTIEDVNSTMSMLRVKGGNIKITGGVFKYLQNLASDYGNGKTSTLDIGETNKTGNGIVLMKGALTSTSTGNVNMYSGTFSANNLDNINLNLQGGNFRTASIAGKDVTNNGSDIYITENFDDVNADGSFQPTIGTMTLDGAYIQNSGSIHIDLLGDVIYDKFVASSFAMNSGELVINFLDDYFPTEATTYNIFETTGTSALSDFSGLTLNVLNSDVDLWSLNAQGALSYTPNQGSGVPEPATWVMLFVGIGFLLLKQKKKG